MPLSPQPEDPEAQISAAGSEAGDRSMQGKAIGHTSGLEALSNAATSSFQYIRPLPVSGISLADAQASPHTSNNLNFILNPAGPEGVVIPTIDPDLAATSPASLHGPHVINDHEVAFLLRHFSEVAGQW